MDGSVTNTVGAAARTGLAVATLEKKRVYGTGPRYAKIGRAVRYRVADLDAWIAEHLIESTSAERPASQQGRSRLVQQQDVDGGLGAYDRNQDGEVR